MIVNDKDYEYHGKKALSNSSMGQLLKCPALFKQAIEDMDGEEHKRTPSLLFGQVFHAMVLEPKKVLSDFAMKQFNGTTKAGKEETAKAKEKGITLVPQDTWNAAKDMADVVNNHPLIKAAKKADDFKAETSVYWEHKTDTVNIPCKARIDGMATIKGLGLVLLDLKTTISAAPDDISRHIIEYGYHRQAAWYKHAVSIHGIIPESFVFLFVEKTPPYLCTAVTIAESAMELAYKDIQTALALYEECELSGNWRGYTDEIVTEVDLPEWVYKKSA